MRDKAYLNTQSLTKSPGESLTGLDTSVGGHSSRKSNSKIFTILSFATNKTFRKKINSFPTVVLSSNQKGMSERHVPM